MFNFSFRSSRNSGWWSEIRLGAFIGMGHSHAEITFPLRRELARIDLAQAELEN